MAKFEKIKKSEGYDEKTRGRGPDGQDIPFSDAVEAIEHAHRADTDPRNNRPRFWGQVSGDLNFLSEVDFYLRETIWCFATQIT